MWAERRRLSLGLALPLAALAWCGECQALIVGRDAESRAAQLEKQGKFKEAAVWRLAAARAFRELIIPFEIESVRAYSEAGKATLARTCSRRAEVLYPQKVRRNLQLYAHDLQKAGGQAVRAEIEHEVVKLLSKYAPIPLSIPSRLRTVEEKEREGKWHIAVGATEVKPGDRVIGICASHALKDLQDLLLA